MDKEKLMTEEEWLAKYNASHKKSKKKNVRKWLRNGVALGLVAVLSIAGTLAYLQKESNTKTNTFTGSAGLKLTLTETQWDWNNDDTADTGEPMKAAESYKPGTEYLKNPQLVNTAAFSNVTTDGAHIITGVTSDSDNTYNEYVAMRIDFSDGTITGSGNSATKNLVTYGDILSVIEPIDFDTDNWELIKIYNGSAWDDVIASTECDAKDTNSDGKINKEDISSDVLAAESLIFAYKTSTAYTKLTANNYTTALYNKIKTLQSIPSALGGTNPTDNGFPTFELIMSGAAVDADASDLTTGTASTGQTTVEAALLKLFGITITP